MNVVKQRKLQQLSLAIALVAGATVAHAATSTANLAVSATVTANCSISATSALNFGAYDPVVANAASDLDGTGTISVTCTSGAPATITLGQGANADTGSTAAAPLRRMTDGSTNFISYSLYSDSSRTVIWGDDATVDVATTGTGAAEAHTVYGRIASAQNVPAGSYSDTVVATVTF